MLARIVTAALFALLAVAAPAHAATLTWDVDASSFAPPPHGGTVNGFFVYDSTLQQITNFNITVAGPSFTPFSLNPTNAQVTIGNNLIFQTTNINFTDSALGEHVFFQTDLTDFAAPNQGIVCFQPGFQPCPRGVSLDQFSSASGPGFLQGALEVATPLPASLPLFGSGVMMLAGFAWRDRGRRFRLRPTNLGMRSQAWKTIQTRLTLQV